MSQKTEKGSLGRNAVIGALVGGIAGAALGSLGYMINIVSSIGGIIIIAMLGAMIGAVVGILSASAVKGDKDEYSQHENTEKPLRKALKNIADNTKFQLREEQLEISKELVQTAEVTSHKEVTTEEKTITVPITREELVIEKRSLDDDTSEEGSKPKEIMRIPIMEEQVEVTKKPVRLEDVSIYKKQYQEMEHIEENVKKEVMNIEASGSARAVDEDSEDREL